MHIFKKFSTKSILKQLFGVLAASNVVVWFRRFFTETTVLLAFWTPNGFYIIIRLVSRGLFERNVIFLTIYIICGFGLLVADSLSRVRGTRVGICFLWREELSMIWILSDYNKILQNILDKKLFENWISTTVSIFKCSMRADNWMLHHHTYHSTFFSRRSFWGPPTH